MAFVVMEVYVKIQICTKIIRYFCFSIQFHCSVFTPDQRKIKIKIFKDFKTYSQYCLLKSYLRIHNCV